MLESGEDEISSAGGLRHLLPSRGVLANISSTAVDPSGLMAVFDSKTLRKRAFDGLEIKNSQLLTQPAVDSCLRRGRDSNSWYGYPYGSLANCWFQPLTHLSGRVSKPNCPKWTANIDILAVISKKTSPPPGRWGAEGWVSGGARRWRRRGSGCRGR